MRELTELHNGEFEFRNQGNNFKVLFEGGTLSINNKDENFKRLAISTHKEFYESH